MFERTVFEALVHVIGKLWYGFGRMGAFGVGSWYTPFLSSFLILVFV